MIYRQNLILVNLATLKMKTRAQRNLQMPNKICKKNGAKLKRRSVQKWFANFMHFHNLSFILVFAYCFGLLITHKVQQKVSSFAFFENMFYEETSVVKRDAFLLGIRYSQQAEEI